MGWSKNDAALGPATRFPGRSRTIPVDNAPTAAAVSWAHPVDRNPAAMDLADILVARGAAVEARTPRSR